MGSLHYRLHLEALMGSLYLIHNSTAYTNHSEVGVNIPHSGTAHFSSSMPRGISPPI